MNQIKEFFTNKNIIAFLLVGILAIGLIVTVRLAQQQTKLKSEAASSQGGEIKFRGSAVSGDGCLTPSGDCTATDRNIQLEITSPFAAAP